MKKGTNEVKTTPTTAPKEFICEMDGRVFPNYKELLNHVHNTYRMPIYAYVGLLNEKLISAREENEKLRALLRANNIAI